MDVTATLTVPCEPDAVFAAVDDLGGYPQWLSLVARAEPTEADDGDPGPAWAVELRGRIGPLARSKRLRMVRSIHAVASRVVFERRELDGRDHAPWRLDARVEPTDDGSTLIMGLHYGGRFGGRPLERILDQEIEESGPRLRALIAGP